MSKGEPSSVSSWDELADFVLKMKQASYRNEEFKQEIVELWNKTKRYSSDRVYLVNLVKRVENYYFPKFQSDRMRLKKLRWSL